MKDVDFKVFSTPATTKGGRVVALRVPGGSHRPRPLPWAGTCSDILRKHSPRFHRDFTPPMQCLM